jgi:AcrR family transcriptional regulator
LTDLRPDSRAAKAAGTKQKLIRAARKVFENKGFVDATVAEIVKKAKVAHGTFYVHFEDKTDVFKAVLIDADRELSHEIVTVPEESSTDLRSALNYSNSRFFEMVRSLSPLHRAIAEAINVDPQVRAIRIAQRSAHIDHVANTIERWQQRGIADPDMDPRHTAAALVCMLGEFAFLAFVYEQPYDIDKMAETVTNIWIRSVGLTPDAAEVLGASA